MPLLCILSSPQSHAIEEPATKALVPPSLGTLFVFNGTQGALGWSSTGNDPVIHTAVTDAVTLEEAGTINLDCVNAKVGEEDLVQVAHLTAIEVDLVNPTADV